MTPSAMIQKAASEGVKLSLSDTGTLKAIGDVAAVERWLPTIRERKGEIIAALLESANDPAPDHGDQMDSPAPMADKSCATCAQAARPGKGNLYCSARNDLPLAYGKHHPLRQLPDDGGSSCPAWLDLEGFGE